MTGAPQERARRGGLLRHRGFAALFAGQSVSVLGSQVTLLALPLAAVLVLRASTFEVGVLTGCDTAAFLVIGLPAGAVVDRMRRRPLMIASDVLRAATLASVPIAAALGGLTLLQLYLVALVQGVGTVFFDVASMSYLPSLVGRSHIVEANAKLQASQSLAQVGGPTVAGALFGAVGAPFAIALDAASYVASVASLSCIDEPEAAPDRREGASLWREVAEGLSFVAREPILRMIAATTSTWNFFGAFESALLVVFLVRQVGIGAGTIGVLFSVGSVGGVLGALCASAFARRIGSARAILLSCVSAPFGLLIPFTSPGAGLIFCALGLLVTAVGVVVYNINQASYRQLLCPEALLGRMNATMRFLVWGTIPIGSLIGGAIGSGLGDRAGLWCATAGMAIAPAFLLASPLRHARDLAVGSPHADDSAAPALDDRVADEAT